MGPLQGYLLSAGFTLIFSYVIWLFRSRVKLLYGRANNSINYFHPNLPDDEAGQAVEVYVEKFFLLNRGRQVATNVEFVLSHFPNAVQVWQPRDEKYKNVSGGNCLI